MVRAQLFHAHSITQLSDGLNLTRQGVTKHPRVLEETGLVRSVRVGRERRLYSARTLKGLIQSNQNEK